MSKDSTPRWSLKCPHCGTTFRDWCRLTPKHAYEGTGLVCPGSEQNPRSIHDRRPLWRHGGVA